MTLNEPTFDDIVAAAAALRGHSVVTPLLHSDLLDQALGCRIFVKAENLQHTGSFKFRGAFTDIHRLSEDTRRRGVVAYSSGNHGQAVAAAARLFGISATILMPSDAPKIKISQTRAQGAEVVFYNRETEEREALATGLAEKGDRRLIKPYDAFDTICGQGTVGTEIASQCRQFGIHPDALFVPCGGGGLTAGVALALEATLPETSLYAVEPEGFDDTRRSLAAGKRLTNTSGGRSLCDALLTPTPGSLTFAINQRLLSDVYAVSDQEVMAAMRLAAHHLKITLEPGGAAALAAVASKKCDTSDQIIVIVASGGNVDAALFAQALNSPEQT